MALDQLDRQARLSDTTAADDDEFVLPQKLIARDAAWLAHGEHRIGGRRRSAGFLFAHP
jgi:hypothetical protein